MALWMGITIGEKAGAIDFVARIAPLTRIFRRAADHPAKRLMVMNTRPTSSASTMQRPRSD
jgi:spore maturation protein SpmA